MNQPQLRKFKTMGALITDKMSHSVPENFVMPDFPIPTEDINSISDILNLIHFLRDNKLDNICLKYRKLVGCEPIISELNQMVGLDDLKATIATQILSLCDRLEAPASDAAKEKEEPLLNTVIYGPPGCGKTTIANFLSKLYLSLGMLENGKIIKGNRVNLIGQYVGDTAIKTEKVLIQALGGILFIDEAYQLGHAADGNRCPFANECINTITQFITEHKGQITIILAGYKKDIQDNFFAQNEGLDRRFPWRYTLERNTSQELVKIFELQAHKAGYTVAPSTVTPDFFSKNKDLFAYSGGDTQVLFDSCKMIHDKRMFSQLLTDNIITSIDLDKGFILFKKNKSEADCDNGPPPSMYG